MRAFGRRCAELRAAQGLSQEQLAEKIGMLPREYQKVEAGTENVTLRTMVTIGNGLGVESLGELFVEPQSLETRPGRPKKAPGG